MKHSRWFFAAALGFVAALAPARTTHAQGVTTSAINARVVDQSGEPRANARVFAVHQASGTHYEGRTRADGRVTLPGMRVGGPYTVTATALGAEPDVKQGIFLTLGVATDLDFTLRTAAVQLAEVTITGASENVFSSERTGAATSVQQEVLRTLPTISGRMEDFLRLTPQFSSVSFGMSFAGQDNRMNNITVDGSYFNNSFGLAGTPGERTGVAPISMEAIEQIQVNIAPFDVRQGNFVGAGVNTVTRSGTNDFQGSVYYSWRDNSNFLHGTKAAAQTVDPGEFDFKKLGISVGGPIMRDKLFFFFSFEDDGLKFPGTTFRANAGGEAVGGSVTRVLASDLDALSNYLSSNFNYETGPYQGYDFETPGTRYLARLDYNLNARNKLSLRYHQLDSFSDILLSNSSSLGFGNRRSNTTGLNFANSNYKILENINSLAAEVNTIVGSNMSNNLIVGYEYHDESRGFNGSFFPMVDVLEGGSVYTTFGFEPFTPNNELRYGSWQLQDNFSMYMGAHELTFGVSGEKYHSENVFFPGSQSAYIYNSLADFYTDANDYLANPNRTTSPVTLNRFQVRWSNIPGQEKPIQPLDVFYAGVYGQDQWRMNDKVKLTFGLRIDRPSFGNTGFANAQVDAMDFRDEDGNTVRYSTSKLPNSNLLFSPRFGFNWDVNGDKTFQVRGGTGVFTGRPAYVWISNQIGENGVLTGFEQLSNTNARPFHPDPNHYKPTSVTGAPAASYGLAFTDADFKFPQLWRTNVAADKRLPWGLVGTAEVLYSRDVNGIYYINANLAPPTGNFTGVDQRRRWVGSNRINGNITSAIVLKNQSEGYSWNAAGSLEKPFGLGTFVKTGYSYGVARNTIDPGSIASGSWTGNAQSDDPNNPGVGYSNFSPGHRFFLAGSIRRNFTRVGATTLSAFWESATIGNGSYVYSGDLNGDGSFNNDLIYIPRNQSEMNFETYTVTISGTPTTFTAQQQADAWEAYIQQDEYLSAHRGEYAERGGAFMPIRHRMDVTLAQEVAGNYLGIGNSLEFRMDFLNFGNLLNKNWGVSQRFVNTQPLIARGADASGAALYRLRNIGTQLMSETFEQTASTFDVYRIQLSVRYRFY